MSGTALTTLLLEVLRRQASRLSAADVMRRYGSDRFVAQGRGHAVAEHLRFAADGLARLGVARVRLELTRLDDAMPDVTEAVAAALPLAGARPVQVVDAPQRSSGRGYYTGLCFKVRADFGAGALDVGDGGFVDWTGQLLGNRKERLLISGYGIDRIAATSGA